MSDLPQISEYYEGIGRRKEASARVRIYPGGTGLVVINDKDGADFLPRTGDLESALSPLRVANVEGTFNVSVIVKGGGITGQTEAIRLGVARALIKLDASLKPDLRHAGYVTRDPRVKERKKPGLKRARKAPTYTKR
jgi:small subunit ribosomal protein S9